MPDERLGLLGADSTSASSPAAAAAADAPRRSDRERRMEGGGGGVGGGGGGHDEESPPPSSARVTTLRSQPPRNAIADASRFLWDEDDAGFEAGPAGARRFLWEEDDAGFQASAGFNLTGGLAETVGLTADPSGSLLTTRNIDWGVTGGGGGVGGGGSPSLLRPSDESAPSSSSAASPYPWTTSAASDPARDELLRSPSGTDMEASATSRLAMPARRSASTADRTGDDGGGGGGDARFPRPDEIEAYNSSWLGRVSRGSRRKKAARGGKKKRVAAAALPDMSLSSPGGKAEKRPSASSMDSVNIDETAMNIAPKRKEDDGASPVRRAGVRKDVSSGSCLERVGSCASSAGGFVSGRKKFLLAVALAAIAVGTAAVITAKARGSQTGWKSLGLSGTEPGTLTLTGGESSGGELGGLDRLAPIRSRILDSGYTGTDALDREGTAQFQALHWLSDWDGAQLSPEDEMLVQRYALAVFFFSTYVAAELADEEEVSDAGMVVEAGRVGEPEMLPGQHVWRDAEHWMTPRGYCSWAGVKCHHRQETNNDDTAYDGNNGVTHLNLTMNNIRGTLPSELAALVNLRVLDLTGNKLTGTVPADLGSLKEMVSLMLSNNDLTGAVPSELGQLVGATHLYLDRNILEGAIPTELGNMESMHVLSLYENYLTGPFPPLQKMKDLRALYLDDNELTGLITGEVLGELTALEDLQLGTNNFTGPIPSQIGNLEILSTAFLEYNALTGQIPWEIYKLKELDELHLHENYLSGTIPYQFGELRDLEVLYLDHNKLVGTIPAPLGDMDDMMELYLQSNQLTGTIPPLLMRLEDLVDLRLDHNALTGPIPHGIQRLFKLEYVDLNNNALNDSVPDGMAELKWLRGVRLHGNDLWGEVPEGLCQLRQDGNLEVLQADCAGDEPAVVCGCCTECFE